jgi:hypothetical protein
MGQKFILKGADIGDYTKKEIKQIEHWINNYPRMILDYASAKDVFEFEGKWVEIEECQGYLILSHLTLRSSFF